jgi:hypothetical protein
VVDVVVASQITLWLQPPGLIQVDVGAGPHPPHGEQQSFVPRYQEFDR